MSNNYEDYEPSGATEYEGPRGTYYDIKYGCLCRISKTEQTGPGWLTKFITLDDGTELVRWYIPAKLEGYVNAIEWYDKEHLGKPYRGYKMTLTAKGQNYIIDWSWNSRATKRLLMTALAIDYEKPLFVNAFTGQEGDLVVTFKQLGESVPQYYKKDDMKDCPPPQEKWEMAKKVWDWSATNNFLWTMMAERVIPHVAKIAAERNLRQQPAGADEFTGQPQAAAAPDRSTTFQENPALAGRHVEPWMPPHSTTTQTATAPPPAVATAGSDDDIPF